MATIGHAILPLICGLQFNLNRLALGTMLFFALLPDLDVLLGYGLTGSLFAMHRGFTHSMLFALIPLLIYLFIRRTELLWGFAGSLSHVLIDLPDSHGTPLLWPLSGKMFGLDFWSSTSLSDVTIPGILAPGNFVSDKLLVALLILYLAYYFGRRYLGPVKRGRGKAPKKGRN